MCMSEACSHSDDSKDEYHPVLQSMQYEYKSNGKIR